MSCPDKDPKKPVPTPAVPTVAPCPECDIEIIDETGKVVTGTPERMVGQRIQLRVRSTPVEQPLADKDWRIGGVIVKEYVQKYRGAYRTNLRPDELTLETVIFYWLDGSFTGQPNTVTVSATTALGQRKTKLVTFKVFMPDVDRFRIIAQATHVTSEYRTIDSMSLTNYHRDPSGHEGSDWDVVATLPSPTSTKADGEVAFVQLINVNRTWTDNAGTPHYKVSNKLVLDDSAPNARQIDLDSPDVQYANKRENVAAGGTFATLRRFPDGDSPKQPLTAQDRSTSASENFELYLMYRPTGIGNIWVTLQMGTWSWGGTTTRIGAPASTANKWNPATGTVPAATTTGLPTTQLPLWSTSFHFVRET